jgi:hypothetical protein
VQDELQNIHGGGLDWELSLYCQPANSPDMNVNDLCFFASIQSLQSLQSHNPINNLDEMIQRLAAIYEVYPRSKLNNSFLTL